MCQNVPICFHCAALRPMSFLQMTNKRQWQICQGSLCFAFGFRKTLGHRCGSNWLSSQDFKNECFLQAIRNEFCGSNASPNSKSTGCVIFLARAVVRSWLWCIFWSFFYWVIIIVYLRFKRYAFIWFYLMPEVRGSLRWQVWWQVWWRWQLDMAMWVAVSVAMKRWWQVWWQNVMAKMVATVFWWQKGWQLCMAKLEPEA